MYMWMNWMVSVTRTTTIGAVRSWWWKIDMRHLLTLALPARVQVHLKYETRCHDQNEAIVRVEVVDCKEYRSQRSPAQNNIQVEMNSLVLRRLCICDSACNKLHRIPFAHCSMKQKKKMNEKENFARPPHSWSLIIYAYWRIRFKHLFFSYVIWSVTHRPVKWMPVSVNALHAAYIGSRYKFAFRYTWSRCLHDGLARINTYVMCFRSCTNMEHGARLVFVF